VEFLVEIEVRVPVEMPDETRRRLYEQEASRGQELIGCGAIRRIWRVPGRTANIGVWEAQDADALHDYLVSLPLHPWLDVRVRPLARHSLEDSLPG
jgi:muconolactone D-isomerase